MSKRRGISLNMRRMRQLANFVIKCMQLSCEGGKQQFLLKTQD